MKNKSKHPLYVIWRSMKQRCYYRAHRRYHRYGGRGITVCDRWRYSFDNFVEDMGLRPSYRYAIYVKEKSTRDELKKELKLAHSREEYPASKYVSETLLNILKKHNQSYVKKEAL